MDRYRKFAAAVLTAVVEGVALWASAPPWAVAVAGFAGAILVYLIPNAA